MRRLTLKVKGWKDKPRSLRFSYLSLYKYCGKVEWILFIVGTLACAASGAPLPVIGILFGELVDDFTSESCQDSSNKDSFRAGVNQKVVYLLIVAVVNWALIWIYTLCFGVFGERMSHNFRTKYLKSLLGQDIAYFDVSFQEGGKNEEIQSSAQSINQRLSTDLLSIQIGLSEKLSFFLSSFSYFITSYILSFILLPRLAVLFLPVIPAFSLVMWMGNYYSRKYETEKNVLVEGAEGIIHEAVSQIKVVKALQAEGKLSNKIIDKLEGARSWGERKAWTAAIALGATFAVGYSSNALAFWRGAHLIAENVGTIGKTYTVLFLLLDASFIIGQVMPFVEIFNRAGTAGQRLISTIERCPTIDVYSSSGVSPPVDSEEDKGSLVFNNVSFEYPSRSSIPVLRNLNLVMAGGKHTAIVGFSGSGKSTIVSLIERFYNPSEGNITLSDRPTCDYNLRWLRGQIGVIMQEPVLFEGSIMDNIAHGLSNPFTRKRVQKILNLAHELTRKEIEGLCTKAAERANAAEFVRKLPRGFETLVGEGGSFLSGGQKQRIALARALVGEPSILILDEATSALDSRSERLILESLKGEAKGGRTIISIAHRISSIKEADKIVVMSAGVVVEEGTHDSLIALGGGYASLVAGQEVSSKLNDSEKSNFDEKKKLHLENDDLMLTDVRSRVVGSIQEVKESEEEIMATPMDELISIFKVLKTIASLTKQQKWLWLVGILTSCFVGAAYQAEAVIFGHVVPALNLCLGVDSVKSSGNLYGLLFFVLGILEWIAYSLNGAAFGSTAERLLKKVKVACYRSLLSRDVSEYEEGARASPSETIAAVSADAGQISMVTGIVIGTTLSVFVNLVSGIILSHIVGWKIAAVVFAVVPVLLIAGLLRIRTIAKFHTRHEKAYHRSTAIASEAVKSIRTIAALSREEDVCSLYMSSLKAPFDESVRNFIVSGFYMAVAFSISYYAYAFAYWWGSRFIASGEYRDVQFFTILPSLLFAAQASGQVFALAPDLTKARYGLSRVFSIMKRGKELKDITVISRGAEKAKGEKGDEDAQPGLSVAFRQVRFIYPSRKDSEVLKGISFELPRGSYTAICGESGSGKSTIIALLQQFYHPTGGSILIDSLPATTSSLPYLSYVPQEPTLFAGTIRFNLCLGVSEDASEQDLDEATRAANIYDFIKSLPDGYDTDCGERGNSFSGGQRQRLAIARALIRKPKILLLDECTAALDSESEAAIQQTIERISHSCTIISIAHRLATIRKADKIMWMEEGVVVEEGSHDELLKRNGLYAAAVKLQELGGPK